MMRTQKLKILAIGLCGASLLAGCSDQGDDTNAHSTASQEAVGSVGLALQLSSRATINSASYTITGPNAFSKTGSIDLSSATKLSATIGGLPAGAGYTITISATAVDGATTCAGSAGFSVVAHQTANVTVPVACKEPARTGSVLVNGTLNICPSIDGINTNPAEVVVGGTIAISALSHDSDAGPS